MSICWDMKLACDVIREAIGTIDPFPAMDFGVWIVGHRCLRPLFGLMSEGDDMDFLALVVCDRLSLAKLVELVVIGFDAALLFQLARRRLVMGFAGIRMAARDRPAPIVSPLAHQNMVAMNDRDRRNGLIWDIWEAIGALCALAIDVFF